MCMFSVRDASMSGVDLRDTDRTTSSAYAYFVAVVGGISDTWMLKRVGARTEPCGTPFLRRFSRLLSPPLVANINVLLEMMLLMNATNVLSGIICSSLYTYHHLARVCIVTIECEPFQCIA